MTNALLVIATGGGDGGAVPGWSRLTRNGGDGDLIDVDPERCGDVPLERRLVTWRGVARSLDDLDQALRTLRATPARFYRLEVEATCAAEALLPLTFLRREGASDVTAYAVGAIGFWTRILAPRFGAPIVFAGEGEAEPTPVQLVDHYGFPRLDPVEQIYGIVGHPVLRSLSPRLHNAGFRALGRPALYLPFDAADFCDFWSTLIDGRGLESLGVTVGALTVVSPHKEIAVSAAATRTPAVSRACSTNFFINDGGAWTADTTDPDGVLLTLRERGIEPRDRRVAVVGCGGSGRAMASALQQAGADVTLVNRGFDRASLAVRLLRLPFMPLASFSARGYSIVINATPLGDRAGELPFELAGLGDDAVVIDLVYRNEPTALVAATRARGQVTIDGHDVLRTQAMNQFRLMTGETMPAEALMSRGVAGHA